MFSQRNAIVVKPVKIKSVYKGNIALPPRNEYHTIITA